MKRFRAAVASCGGAVATAIALVGGAEVYLRAFPPRELMPFLGDESPLAGVCVADPDFGVGFPSLEALRADNPRTLADAALLTPQAHARAWAFFGSSFVHMQGALADTVREHVPEHPVFLLDRRETLTVRMGQIKTLLENGFRPERIFLTVMPVDVSALAEQPLVTHRVTPAGALTYAPRLPPGVFGELVGRSRFALAAWARTGRHRGNPGFGRGDLYDRVEPTLLADLTHMFTALGRLSREHGVPITLLFIPVHRQTARRAGFAFQDAVVPLAADCGLDVLDPRQAFLAGARSAELYQPDGHLSQRGNLLLLGEMREHLANVAVAGRGQETADHTRETADRGQETRRR